jgi:carboxyl-terminal processing protease
MKISFNSYSIKIAILLLIFFKPFTNISFGAGAEVQNSLEIEGASLDKENNDTKIENSQILLFEKLNKVIELSKASYVNKLEDEQIFENAAKGILEGLDANSGYLNPQELTDIKTNLSGKFAGIGIEIIKDKDFVKVISPIEDSPAQRAGIKSGDYIVKVDKINLSNKKIDEIVKLLRGDAGSVVTLYIARDGNDELLNISVTRDIIESNPVKSIFYTYGGILYIKINSFIDTTFEEVYNILKDNMRQSKAIIVDLRNNPGGELEQAILLANLFLSKGDTIVKVKGRSKEYFSIADEAFTKQSTGKENLPDIKETEEGFSFTSSSKPFVKKDIPIVVMVNEGSASASEIFTGALKDNSRAIILGTKTFGKGSVQSIIPIEEGELGAIRLTTAKYYTPNGSSVHEVGIYPDIFVQQKPRTIKDGNESEKGLKNSLTLQNISHTIVTEEDVTSESQESKKIKQENAIKQIEEATKNDYQLDIAFGTLKAAMLFAKPQKEDVKNDIKKENDARLSNKVKAETKKTEEVKTNIVKQNKKSQIKVKK